jgi:hypothetical protein
MGTANDDNFMVKNDLAKECEVVRGRSEKWGEKV